MRRRPLGRRLPLSSRNRRDESAKAKPKVKAKAGAKRKPKAKAKTSPKRAKRSQPDRVKKPSREPEGRSQSSSASHAQRAVCKSAACSVFGKCGGCDLLDIPYAKQLESKQAQIEGLFKDLAPSSAFRKIKGMDDPHHYRDKVISPFVFGDKLSSGKRRILTGMYEAGTHHVLQTDGCLMENEVAQRVIKAVRKIMSKYDMQPYDEDRGCGFIRHVVVRIGHETGEVLVTVVTNEREFPHSKSFSKKLIEKVPEITTIVQNVNTRQTNVILGEEARVLYGPGFILDTLCSLSFRISSGSFYQVNSMQTEVLYRSAMELAHPEEGDVFIDAYCGTGTIGLVAASMGASRVLGFDSVDAAIRDARMNAKHNGITNAEFVCADADEFMRSFRNGVQKDPSVASLLQDDIKDVSKDDEMLYACHPEHPSAIPTSSSVIPSEVEGSFCESAPGNLTLLMDPPRAGSTEGFLNAVIALKPRRIVYISCNPITQARDVEQLVGGGYTIETIQPIDMFPHTKHIENIVSLSVD